MLTSAHWSNVQTLFMMASVVYELLWVIHCICPHCSESTGLYMWCSSLASPSLAYLVVLSPAGHHSQNFDTYRTAYNLSFNHIVSYMLGSLNEIQIFNAMKISSLCKYVFQLLHGLQIPFNFQNALYWRLIGCFMTQ